MAGRFRFAGLLAIASTAMTTAQAQTTSESAAKSSDGRSNQSWVVRDPATGRLFQQSVITVTVPTTQWEVRPVMTTVYEPTRELKTLPTQRTIYTPHTQYVMQPRLRGWWKPLRQSVQAYEYVPVTTWQPQTQTMNTQMATVQWVPKQQVVYVQQPVRRMQTQQQVVLNEISQPSIHAGVQSQPMLAAQPQPLIRIPLLAQQRMLPPPSVDSAIVTQQAASLRSTASTGLRPINNAAATGYNAPLRTAAASDASMRDTFQTGMAATVLR